MPGGEEIIKTSPPIPAEMETTLETHQTNTHATPMGFVLTRSKFWSKNIILTLKCLASFVLFILHPTLRKRSISFYKWEAEDDTASVLKANPLSVSDSKCNAYVRDDIALPCLDYMPQRQG